MNNQKSITLLFPLPLKQLKRQISSHRLRLPQDSWEQDQSLSGHHTGLWHINCALQEVILCESSHNQLPIQPPNHWGSNIWAGCVSLHITEVDLSSPRLLSPFHLTLHSFCPLISVLVPDLQAISSDYLNGRHLL